MTEPITNLVGSSAIPKSLDVAPGDHVIAIVTEAADVELLVPFFGSSLGHHACSVVAAETHRDDCAHALRNSGVHDEQFPNFDDPRADGCGPDGVFDPDRFMNSLRTRNKSWIANGAKRVFRAGLMRWMEELQVPADDRVYLEAQFNTTIEGSCASGLCIYDARVVGADMLLRLIRTHPKIVVDGAVTANPLYEPPESVLRSLGRA
ncbi:MAG: MEDS domain-containing protein [Planctomycetota bacterium]